MAQPEQSLLHQFAQTRSLELTLAVIDSSPDGIELLDMQGQLLLFNPRYLAMWGFASAHPEELTASERLAHQLARLRQAQRYAADFRPDLVTAQLSRRDRFELNDGRWFERDVYDHMVGGVKSGLVIHWRDVTELHEANRAAAYERELMLAMMESVPDQIYFKDTQSRILRINTSLARRYGLDDPAQAVGKTDQDFYSAEHAAQTRADEIEIMRTGKPLANQVHQEVWSNGTTTWNMCNKMPLRDSQGNIIGTYGIAHDITEQKKNEALIWQQANFDTLTGLPNRRMLRDRWNQALNVHRRSGHILSLLILDLDRFKEINDTLGHARGDELLVAAAKRIRGCLRSSDTLARMGGDEFAIILTEIGQDIRAADVAQKVVSALAEPFVLGEDHVFVSASVGISLYPQDGEQMDELFKKADQAMYDAKARGRNGFSFFTPALQASAQARLKLGNDLRTALAKDEFLLVYQPIVNLATGSVNKAEVLIRWEHPKRGAVSPSEFIPVAESAGLIVDIGEWVFRQAALQVQQWRKTLSPAMQISINKSPVQFQSSVGSPTEWVAHLQSLGLVGDAIVVEITEGLLLDTADRVQSRLLELRDSGMQVSLDDFGTGYSSLSYLTRFDIDFIKIDQSFMRDLGPDTKNLTLCRAIVRMAHELGMRVIAEGIETQGQLDLLRDMGCDFGQGYLFSRPLSSVDFEQWVQNRS